MLPKILGLPINASEQGARIDWLIFYVHILMVVLFIGWIAFFLYTIFHFRKSRHPRADYAGVKTHASSYLEAAVAVIEVALFGRLMLSASGMPLAVTSRRLPSRPSAPSRE